MNTEMDKVMKVASMIDRHPDMTKEELKDLMDIAAAMADHTDNTPAEMPKESPKERFFKKIWHKLFH